MGTRVGDAVALLQPADLDLDLAGKTVGPVTFQAAAELAERTAQLSPLACDHILVEFHRLTLSCRLNGRKPSALSTALGTDCG